MAHLSSSFDTKALNSSDNQVPEGSGLGTSHNGEPLRRRSFCSGQMGSASRLQDTAEEAQVSTSCKRSKMRARSLSNSQLISSNHALFAPLPEYAQYQERKTQRALSRRCVFTETPSSPGLESRQTKIVISRDLLDISSRQPASPTKGDESRVRRRNSSGSIHGNLEEDENAHVFEVAPGETAVLRCANETVRAVLANFVAPVNCFFCTLGMFCIADAKYVLCPECRVVSPVVARTGAGLSVGKQKGLGLGFSYNELVAIKSRKVSPPPR